jgi:hypothetical protein
VGAAGEGEEDLLQVLIELADKRVDGSVGGVGEGCEE